MKAIVTCGPSFEPIDQVRRLTNFSTGSLGVQLCESLVEAGWEVHCFKGSAATHPDPRTQCHLSHFDTNDDLLHLLRETRSVHHIAAVFHVAALCDYKVKKVEDEQGKTCQAAKIASRSGALTLTLEPATKVIRELRGLFPASQLVGWKYELNGTREDAIGRAYRQLEDNHTDACVVNGAAYGVGFGFCRKSQPVLVCKNKAELLEFLPNWIRKVGSIPELRPA